MTQIDRVPTGVPGLDPLIEGGFPTVTVKRVESNMESGRQDTDPSVLLANEFEIRSTQVRLMELCVKQAQATAADAVARVRTQLAALQGKLKHPDLGPETHPTLSNQGAQSQESGSRATSAALRGATFAGLSKD